MKKENPVRDKSFRLAKDITSLCKEVSASKKEYVLTRQLLRSGTSVGANIVEGVYGESKRDFCHKFSIALKEAHESIYWIMLLYHGRYINEEEKSKICDELNEIIALLTAILKKARHSIRSQ